jgi:hypothetical protein
MNVRVRLKRNPPPSKPQSKVLDGLREILAWSRGEGRLTVWLPDGTKAELSAEEYEWFRRNQTEPTP